MTQKDDNDQNLHFEFLHGSDAGIYESEIVALRLEAWSSVTEQTDLLARFFFDDFDRSGWHRLVRNKVGEIVAASRICFIPKGRGIPDADNFSQVALQIRLPAVFFNRSVVKSQWRGLGLQRQMFDTNMQVALSRSAQELWSETSQGHATHLLKIGFERIAESDDSKTLGQFVLLRYRP